MEDVYLQDRPYLPQILPIVDKAFTMVFLGEAILKWFAIGMKRYFSDAWCWLDFTIVVIAILSMAIEAIGTSSPGSSKNVGAFKAMRTLRALRPLRAVSRWEAMKVSFAFSLLLIIPFSNLQVEGSEKGFQLGT